MRITTIGAGPVGLYFALLMKQADPSHEITVFERDGERHPLAEGPALFAQATADAVEGITAFIEKRTPVWSHK